MTPFVITPFKTADYTKVLHIDFSNRTNLAYQLYKRGIRNPYAKILLQGTRLQGANLAEREQRLRALACLHMQFPFMEIHDPLLKNEGWLAPYGMKIVHGLTNNYSIILHLDDDPVFNQYTEDFYKSICKKQPVLLKAA